MKLIELHLSKVNNSRIFFKPYLLNPQYVVLVEPFMHYCDSCVNSKIFVDDGGDRIEFYAAETLDKIKEMLEEL